MATPLCDSEGYWRPVGTTVWRSIRTDPPPANDTTTIYEWLDAHTGRFRPSLVRNEAEHERIDRVQWSIPMPDRRGPQRP